MFLWYERENTPFFFPLTASQVFLIPAKMNRVNGIPCKNIYSIEANAVKLYLQLLFWRHTHILFRDLQKEAHNLAYYQQLKSAILKLDLRDVGLWEKSSSSYYGDPASCQFSHIEKEKLLKLVMRSRFLYIYDQLI